MLGRIADSIAVLFLKKNIINEDELPVYQYGMQVYLQYSRNVDSPYCWHINIKTG